MRSAPTAATRIIVVLAATLFLLSGCKTKPDPQGVESSAPEPTTTSADMPATPEVVTDPFGPGSDAGDLTATDLTEGEIGTEAGDSAWAEGRLETVYFDFDQATLSEQARASLTRNSEFLRSNPGLRIRIEGHCDERGTVEYNLALGDRRASTVKAFLSQLGVDVTSLEIVSYGEERPADPGHDDVSWARNRRAEFHVR